MKRQELDQTATELVTDTKGILADDETVPTLTKRFATLKIESTEDSGRATTKARAASAVLKKAS